MKAKYYSSLFVALIVTYILFSLLPSPSQKLLTQYHISVLQAHLLVVAIALPLVIIWIIAMYGFIKLKDYALLIKKTKDGHAFNTVSKGLLFLAIGSPLAAAASSIINYLVAHHANWTKVTTIMNNYISLLAMAIGLYFVARGAEQLVSLVRKKPSKREQNALVLLFIILSTIYAHLVVLQPIRTAQGVRAYYMPNIVVLLTLAVPYLYFWYRGLVGAYYIFHYQRQISGRLYKQPLVVFAFGITVVILSSIFVRLLSTISARITAWSLTPILIIIYSFLLLSAIGYILIALGAKRLQKIEEV